eukprot:1444459-Rhodomonas_salina.1
MAVRTQRRAPEVGKGGVLSGVLSGVVLAESAAAQQVYESGRAGGERLSGDGADEHHDEPQDGAA